MICFRFRRSSPFLLLPRIAQLLGIGDLYAHSVCPCGRRSRYNISILSRRLSLVSGQKRLKTGKKYSIKLPDRKSSYHDNITQDLKIKKDLEKLQNEEIKDTISFRDFILKNTQISRGHLTPEIALHLMTRDCRLWHTGADESLNFLKDHGIGDPFWAFYWPGGQALTRYILDNPNIVCGKTVLDVGSGCGASAIAAKMGGAKSVSANDIDKVAIDAIHLNASLNNVTIATTSQNLIGCSARQWDVVFLGDMFYDKDFTNTVADWLSYLVQHETDVLIGDPGRLFLQEHPIKEKLKKVFRVELSKDCQQENNGMTHGFVWKLDKQHS